MKRFVDPGLSGALTWWRSLPAVLGFMLVAGAASDAHARRGVMLINTGEDVMSIREVPAEVQEQLELPEGSSPLQVGIKYSRFGVFFLDIARWNSEFCLFTEEADGFSYEAATPAQLAELTGVSESEIKIPIRYYLPPGGVLLGLVVLGGGALVAMSARADAKHRETLMADPRYASTVQAFNAQPQVPVEHRLAEAVNYLASTGIPPAEAKENLEFLCGISNDDDES